MPKIAFEWSDGAKKLLRKRDHYTRDAIVGELKTNPQLECVAVDPDRRWFATPVANRRYSIIWKQDAAEHGIVEALVPAQFASNQEGHLMQRVQDIVEFESDGDVRLIP